MLQRLPSYLTSSRHGVYYFQIRIPQERQFLYSGRTLFRKSLRTKNHRDALYLAQRWWLRMKESNFDYEQTISQEAELYTRGKILDTEYYQIDPNDTNQKNEFFISLTNYDTRALEYYGELKHLSNEQAKIKEIEPLINNSTISSENSESISQLLEKYINEKKGNWQEHSRLKTEDTVRNHLKLFVKSVDDIAANTLQRTHIVQFKDLLLNLPKNKEKSKKYKHMSIDELRLMNTPTEERISTATIKGYIDRITSFLDWGESNGYFSSGLDAPLKNAKKGLKTNKRANARRDVFSDDDLSKLFSSKQYTQGKHKRASHHWAPLLAIFTGARLGEICSLSKEDVRHDKNSDFWYLDINGNVKTDCSVRFIPIHQQLIKLGFINFVKGQSNRLFPELQKTKNGYGDTLSKWFNNTYLNASNCNVGQLASENKCFHSFRHTFLDAFKQQGLNLLIAEELAGHSPEGSQTQVTYTKGYSLEIKNIELQKLKYHNVSFNQIRTWKK